MRVSFFAFAALTGVVACSKPVPPTLVPKTVKITTVSPASLGLEVTLDATNPNSIDIPARDVTAHVVINDNIEVGAATASQQTNLPANQTTELKVAVSVPWTDLLPLAALATGDQRIVPYTVDGTVALGGDLVRVSLPYHFDGKVNRDQIVHAALSSIPGIPGVTGPIDPGAPSPGGSPGRRSNPRAPR